MNTPERFSSSGAQPVSDPRSVPQPAQAAFSVKFWGVRGSHPVPGPQTVRFGGNTPCVQVQAGGHSIILDAGTGIIALGAELARQARSSGKGVEATLLFSHVHHDHIHGFPFFAPAYQASTRLHIFGPDLFELELGGVLARSMNPPFFPVSLRELSASKSIHSLQETQVVLLGHPEGSPLLRPALPASMTAGEPGDLVRIRILRSSAHPGGVLIYRIEWRGRSVVYATDTEGYANIDRRLAEFARGADLLIHDAQYTDEHYLGLQPGFPATQGWGHSTVAMACDLARAAGVGRLALFHFEPRYDDAAVARLEASARSRFEAAFAAREGLSFDLEGPAALGDHLPAVSAEWSLKTTASGAYLGRDSAAAGI